MLNLNKLKTMFGCVALGAAVSLSAPVYAANDAMMDLLKILRDKGSISAEEYDLLANASKADKEKVEGVANEVKGELAKKTKGLPKFSTDKGKLEIKSANGEYKFRVGGRLQADWTAGLGDVGVAAGNDTFTEFRRARMYLSGVLAKHWKFKFQYDFADPTTNTDTSIDDAYLRYTGFKNVDVTLGHQKTTFGMETQTSSKYISFIERAQMVEGIVSDTGGDRQIAVRIDSRWNDQFTLGGAIHGGGPTNNSPEDFRGLTGRVTWSPIHEKTKAIHLGGGFSQAYSESGFGDLDAEPEIHPGRDIIDTADGTGITRDFQESTAFNVEAAGVWGPFSLQAEYASAELKDSETIGQADVEADAFYIYGTYYLTGESRRYNWKSGTFKQTKVLKPLGKGGYGAWELGVRYSSGDYENGDGTSDEADILTAGLSWYPNNNVRFALNYVTVLDANDGADGELTGGGQGRTPTAEADDAEYLILRSQWYF